MAEFQAFHQTHSFRRDNFRKDEDWSGRQSHICYRIFTIEYLQQTCQRRCPERDSAFFSFADEISVLRLMEIAIPQIHQPRSQTGFASPADGSGQPRNPSATAKISSSFCHNFATSFVYFCQYRFDYDVTVLEESIQMGLKRPREANPASTFIIKAHS